MKLLIVLVAAVSGALAGQEAMTFHRVSGTNWATWAGKDAMTDRPNAEARLWSNDRSVQMSFQCDNSGDQPQFSAGFLVRYDVGDSLSRVSLRYDGGAPESSLWQARNDLVRSLTPEDLAKKVVWAKSIVVRIEDHQLQPHDATFNSVGGADALKTVSETCSRG